MHSPQHMLDIGTTLSRRGDTRRRDDDGKVWLHTGDLAYIDEDGYVFLVDRKKDMMKTSGFQVWPREIEEVISRIRRCWRSVSPASPIRPKAKSRRPGSSSSAMWPGANVDEIRAYCRERLAPYKVPAHVEFRTELPKTMVGKILRRVLVAETMSSN